MKQAEILNVIRGHVSHAGVTVAFQLVYTATMSLARLAGAGHCRGVTKTWQSENARITGPPIELSM
jgi:hypothetical protein